MPRTQFRTSQILDGTVGRADLNVTDPGNAVVAKSLSGGGLVQSYTGPVAGTGDVIHSLAQFNSRYPTSSTTLLTTDGLLFMNCTGVNNVTVPTGSFPDNAIVNVTQIGVGQTSIVAGSGVTFIAAGSLNLRTQGSMLTLTKLPAAVAANTWIVSGDTDDVVVTAAVLFKAVIPNNGSNTQYQLPAAFTTIVPTNLQYNIGNGSFSTSTGYYTVGTKGVYDCLGIARAADNTGVANIGLGIGTTNADSQDFFWANDGTGATTNRTTFQYSNRLLFNVGDQVRLFGFGDAGGSVNFWNAIFAMTLIAKVA